MLKLHFLGRGAAFYPRFGNTNAWFEKNKYLFFLDFGEEAFHKVIGKIPLEQYDRIFVLLTHLHADHAGSLASLCSYTHLVLKRDIVVIHPVDSVVKMLRIQGIADSFYTWMTELPDGCGVKARQVEVAHAEDMKAYGYLLSDGDQVIYYSGDAARLGEDIVRDYLKGDINEIYHDTASHMSQSHCCYRILEEQIPEEKRKHVYCMHLDGDYVNLLRDKGFSVVEVDL